jgi:LmbE family N-acetylglucosaminyl deacetylase
MRRIAFAVFLLLASLLNAQAPDPLADHGAAALRRDLLRAKTTASLLMVTAHPDDEDGGLLTLLSRGRGVRVGLVTLTRGEGGQNKIGPELFDDLGLTRTQELLASDRYYGVEQFFTRAADYGFSKTLSEALQKWRFAEPAGGPVVEDLVRVIREFKPDVLVARFSGTTRDGHAHHQASSILARKAFELSADASILPGIAPWKPRKLYIGVIRANEDWTLTEDVGRFDPLLGAAYSAIAWQGLSHQRTQGVGQVRPDAGPRPVYYRRIDGTPAERVLDTAGKIEAPFHEGKASLLERSFFDGIDTTIPGLAQGGSTALKRELRDLDRLLDSAVSAFDALAPEKCAPHLASALRKLEAIRKGSGEGRAELATEELKIRQALNAALSLEVVARVEPDKDPGSPFPGFRFAAETRRGAVAGETFPVSVALVNNGRAALKSLSAAVAADEGWSCETVSNISDTARALFRLTPGATAPPTAPFWHRDSSQEALYVIDEASLIGRALPRFPLRAEVSYEYEGVKNSVSAIVQTRQIDPFRGELSRDLALLPALSIRVDPPLRIIPLERVRGAKVPVEMEIANNSTAPQKGLASLELPPGFPRPADLPFSLAKEKDSVRIPFVLDLPGFVSEGVYEVEARSGAFDRTVEFLEHPDIAPFYDLRPARTRIEVVDVHVPGRLLVGYVRGPEDSIPEFLQQLGIDVHSLSADELMRGDLSRYSTIITGPRAYDVRDDLRRANARLLEYVRNGGRLVVQYNSNIRLFGQGDFFPFPVKFADQNLRVVVEDSPVLMLSPGDSLWSYPNKITTKDFDGWVQERGLYFPAEWDSRYTPLLSLSDPGEEALRGGLLKAAYGKGTYIFTGLSWFRELPEGVPGAIRIFVNLISPPV